MAELEDHEAASRAQHARGVRERSLGARHVAQAKRDGVAVNAGIRQREALRVRNQPGEIEAAAAWRGRREVA